MVMQQPDLGRMGRLTGPPLVTMGDLQQLDYSSGTAVSTEGLFGLSWTSVAMIGGVLIGGAFLLKHLGQGGGSLFGGGGAAPSPRRRRSRGFHLPKVSLTTVALLGAAAYLGSKYLTQGSVSL